MDPEYPRHDLTHRGKRIQLAPLDALQDGAELAVVLDGGCEVRPGARRADGDHLCGEVRRASPLQAPGLDEVRSVRLNRNPELVHALAPRRLGQDDRRVPIAVGVEGQDGANLVRHRLRGGMVAFVHGDDVGDLHDPRLERLDRVARPGHQDEEDRVRDRDDLDLALSRSHRLEEEHVLSGGVEDERGLERRLGEAAEVPARAHGADEDVAVEEVVREPDAVAEERALRERARRVDRDHSHRRTARTQVADQGADEGRLPDARRSGDSQHRRPTCLGVDGCDHLRGQRVAVLDERDRPCERAPVGGTKAGDVPGSSSAGAARSAAASAAPPKQSAAATPHATRAPQAFVRGPATIIPTPTHAYPMLMTSVNARPRIQSGTARWTRTALQTMAAPFPKPQRTTTAAASQKLGDAAATPNPTAVRAIAQT